MDNVVQNPKYSFTLKKLDTGTLLHLATFL